MGRYLTSGRTWHGNGPDVKPRPRALTRSQSTYRVLASPLPRAPPLQWEISDTGVAQKNAPAVPPTAYQRAAHNRGNKSNLFRDLSQSPETGINANIAPIPAYCKT